MDLLNQESLAFSDGSVNIFQTFMTRNGDELTANFLDYPSDFFDLVIVDECHRGGANDESTWRKILEYFAPAVQLGLTATPKRDINGDTYEYFGEPLYTYSLKEGINEGYLTPFKVVEFTTNLDEYQYDPDDELDLLRKYLPAPLKSTTQRIIS